MSIYGNDRDVTDRIRTTDVAAVNREVDRIFIHLYPGSSTARLDRAFADLASLYRGQYPGYLACDTAYHDIQHVLDVTLAMARLVDGYERGHSGSGPLGPELFELGVITALFHDSGYIRHLEEADRKGAEFTIVHVSRGGNFLKDYLPRIGLESQAPIAADLIHFTGYERVVANIQVPTLEHRLLGNLLGSADIIAQMSDRCYLEKCRDRLYPEFVWGGIARRKRPDNGTEEVVFESAEDLLHKTPDFYAGANRRLEHDLQGGYSYAGQHFGGQNLYIDGVEKNIRFARKFRDTGDEGLLKRIPPPTQADKKR